MAVLTDARACVKKTRIYFWIIVGNQDERVATSVQYAAAVALADRRGRYDFRPRTLVGTAFHVSRRSASRPRETTLGQGRRSPTEVRWQREVPGPITIRRFRRVSIDDFDVDVNSKAMFTWRALNARRHCRHRSQTTVVNRVLYSVEDGCRRCD